MKKSIYVLIFEGSGEDVKLVLEELQRGGFDTDHEWVETIAAMEAALEREAWDVIIANHTTNSNSLAMVKLLRNKGLDLPVIIVSSLYGEDIAVTTMKAGASDYIMKDNLSRLVPSVEDVLSPGNMDHGLAKIGYSSELDLYRTIVNSMADLAYASSAEGNILFVNGVFEKMSGHKPEEFLGKSYAPLFDEENLALAIDAFTRTLKGETTHVEIYFKDTGVLCEYKNIPWRNKNGNIVGVIGIGRDTTERKHLENELKKINNSLEQCVSERTEKWQKANEALQIKIVQHTKAEALLAKNKEQLQSILDNTTAVIYIKDRDGRYILVNHQFETLFHVDRHDLMGKTDVDIFPAEIAETFQANDRRVFLASVPLELEEMVPHADGLHTYISLKFPLLDISGVPDRICGISTDITRLKRMEEKSVIYQTQLKSLSSALLLTEERERRHISEYLHNTIGQTLTVIKMKLGGQRYLRGTDNEHVLNEIDGLLDKTIQDTRTLMFEISPLILYDLGFEPAIEWLIEQFGKRHNIPIVYDGKGDIGILGDDVGSYLFKSVRELLFNTVKYARAGSIKVSVRGEKNRVRVRVEDDGVGFDPSKVQLSVDSLSGFGLFSMRESMEHFNGVFDIESKPGHGTRITIEIPLGSSKGDRDAKR